MKGTKIFAAALLFCVSAVCLWGEDAQSVQEVAQPWRSSIPVWIGREIPRTQTICYDSELAARDGSHEASRYFQPLDHWSAVTSADGATATFKNTFKFPFAWADRQLFFYIGSANAPYEVVVNGTPAGYNQSAGTPAEFNITKFAEEGINTIEVVVHPDAKALILSGGSTQPNAAITAETYIVAQPRVRIRDYVARTVVEGGDAVIELGVILKSELLNPKTLTLHYTLLSPDGMEVSSGRRDREIDMRQEDTLYFVINVPQAKLWSPEEPNLYTLVLKTQNEGRYWEWVPYRIGIRTVGVENGQLLVNGRKFPFRIAEYKTEPRESTQEAVPALKEQDINLIVVDSPQPEWFYDLCDEKGFFVFNSADIDTRQSGDSREVGGNPANDPQWEEGYTDRMEAMLYTSCNHPSVIAFSLAATPGNGCNTYESYLRAKQILARRGDGRPVVFDEAGGEWNTDAVTPQTAKSKPETVAGRFVLEPDKTPAPAVVFAEKNPREGLYTITNNLSFRTLDLSVAYTVKQGNSRVSRGEITTTVPSGSQVVISVPYGRAKAGGKPLDVELSTSVKDFGETNSQAYSKTFRFGY